MQHEDIFNQLSSTIANRAKKVCGEYSHYPYIAGYSLAMLKAALSMMNEEQLANFVRIYQPIDGE